MKKNLIIDSYNLFFRALYTINDRDIELCKGMLLHLMFMMIKNACDKFKPDHLVLVRDGNKSWRKEVYTMYKANRVAKLQERTPYEIERDDTLKDLFENEFLPFIENKTNLTYLSYDYAEADDLIARFIHLHKDDINIILSTDNDFVQLLSDTVVIYNSMENRLITNKCVMDADKNIPIKFTLKDGKISVSKTDRMINDGDTIVPYTDWVEYALFCKCIRGDKSDNIFSAYPGVREKSTKKKVGIREAFEGMKAKNLAWNNFINEEWVDAFGEKHNVKNDYEFNKKIIDLNEIPAILKNGIDNYIKEQQDKERKSCVGINLLKFFEKWSLLELSKNVNSLSGYFNNTYKG